MYRNCLELCFSIIWKHTIGRHHVVTTSLSRSFGQTGNIHLPPAKRHFLLGCSAANIEKIGIEFRRIHAHFTRQDSLFKRQAHDDRLVQHSPLPTNPPVIVPRASLFLLPISVQSSAMPSCQCSIALAQYRTAIDRSAAGCHLPSLATGSVSMSMTDLKGRYADVRFRL